MKVPRFIKFQPRRPEGFTLTELLVALAVLLALAALLFPALSKARNSSDKAICVSNLKKIGMGMHAYASDNDGFFPPGFLPASKGSGTLEDFLEPYVAPWISRERGIAADTFYCPTNVRLGSPPKEGYRVNAKGESHYKGWSGYFIGYRINGSMHPIKGEPSTDPNATEEDKNPTYRIRLARVKLPSKVVSLLETNTREDGGGPPSAIYDKASYFNPAHGQFAGFGRVHNGFGNILFVDGHVESFDGSRPLPVASLPHQETTWWP